MQKISLIPKPMNSWSDFLIFSSISWVLLYGISRLAQTIIFTKPTSYILINISDVISGVLLSIILRLLIDRLLAKINLLILLSNILMVILAAIIWNINHEFIYHLVFPEKTKSPLSTIIASSIMLPTYLFLTWCFCYGFWQMLLRNEYERTSRQKAESLTNALQLNILKSKLAPHFLFNAMNCLYDTAIKEDATDTQDIILKLSSLLRYSCRDNNSGLASLTDEINFAIDYLSIEQKRFGSRIKVNLNICNPLPNMMLPIMSIQPLFENVFLHAVTKTQKTITMSVNINTDDHFELSISNDLYETKELSSQSLGLSLKSLQQRLVLFSPDAELVIHKTSSSFKVTMMFPMEMNND